MPFIVVLCLAGFASSFALRAVEPMLPVLAADLDITLQQAVWLVTAFSTPYAVMQLILGPVGDAVGKALLIRISMIAFTAAMAFCVVAPGFDSLIVGRAISGAFAGGLIPVAMALIGDRVAYEGRQIAMSRFLMATISGQTIGAAIIGLLADWAGWRPVFALLAVIAALCSVPVLLYLRGSGERRVAPTLGGAISGYRLLLRNPMSAIVYATVIAEGVLAIEMGASAEDLKLTIHPHPTTSESLMESELFGHEKGSFTGALGTRAGCFEMANHGTLLLDEIAEMPLALQPKLLRVLEDRRVRRLGGAQEILIDVRVLAATNRPPAEAIKADLLREDLYYRLNVFTVGLPPLQIGRAHV